MVRGRGASCAVARGAATTARFAAGVRTAGRTGAGRAGVGAAAAAGLGTMGAAEFAAREGFDSVSSTTSGASTPAGSPETPSMSGGDAAIDSGPLVTAGTAAGGEAT